MSTFVDIVRIKLKAGDGGDGKVSFHREKFVQAGGPDGGDGGRGGDIVFVADPGMHTLLDFRYNRKFYAEAGAPGGAGRASGKSGAALVIKVPPGTLVRDMATDKVLADVREPNEPRVVLHGGRGGWGNSHFANAVRQAPNFAKPGVRTKVFDVQLELKTIADVGLVGFPNVGKSTILSVLTAAKPKIANYAFTTLEPNLGIVECRDHHSFVMADIPGIIEGAHEGKGLGTRFLRHIERNSVLLFMIPADSDDIRKDYAVLLGELTQYNPELLDKERLLAITKCDMLDEELIEEMKSHLPEGVPSVFISSISGMNIPRLKDMLWEALQK